MPGGDNPHIFVSHKNPLVGKAVAGKVINVATLPKRIEVDLATQTLTAYQGDVQFLQCDCVTGRSDHPTAKGTHQVMEKKNPCSSMSYRDSKGNPIPMNYAMRFTDDWQAIHQFNPTWGDGENVKWLQWKIMNSERWLADHNDTYRDMNDVGSHGCVRLSEEDAKTLYDWVPDPKKTPFRTAVIVK